MRHQPYLTTHPDAALTEEGLVSRPGTPVYRFPQMPFIGRNAETRELLQLEAALPKTLSRYFAELARVMQLTESNCDQGYWHQTVPEGLAAILNTYERGSAIAAAIGYLRQEGFVVEIPAKSATVSESADD